MLELGQSLKVGILPSEIDALAQKLFEKNNVRSGFLGAEAGTIPYPAHICISVNDTVLHGVPSKTNKFKKGDIVKIDLGVIYENKYYTDQCFTFVIEKLSKRDSKLVTVARTAVENAINKAIVGNTTGDIGHEMLSTAKKAGFNMMSDFLGPGSGLARH